ncbi:MAG: PAS domain-containing protein [Deltaproteobacteria bacterium]|nr:PAS domain-containing protein [Deltaproteobacteria bacterium]
MVSLVLLGLLTLLTAHRLDENRRLWRQALTRQGGFIMGSLEASCRAGMRMMRQVDPRTERRLQYLAEEMGRVGLVKEVFLLDKAGRVVIHSDPARVGLLEADGAEMWTQAHPVFAAFSRDGFQVVSLFRPTIVFRNRRPDWLEDGGFLSQPHLGVVVLPAEEYRAARAAELRQAVGLGAAIFAGALGLMIALVYFHDRRLLARLQETTGHLIEQMPAGLISADQRGRVLTANGQARRMWGLGPGEEVGIRLQEAFPAEPERVWGKLERLSPQESLADLETELASGEEKIPVSLSAVRLDPAPEDPTAYILILRDLRQVRQLEERLKRSERLAALGRLSAGVAHEIRNPLSSIRGLAQYLASKLAPGSEGAKVAKVMVGEADRLNRVVSDLLTYARPSPPRLAATDLNELAGRVAGLMAEEATAKGVELSLDLEEELDLVRADADQLTQVMVNLILNAMESGAEMATIQTRSAPGRAAFLRVSDDGPGVEEEIRDRLFDPFVTTKAGGSGLGLAISARIVEEHGGSISLQSGPGGAAFELRLDLAGKESDEA